MCGKHQGELLMRSFSQEMKGLGCLYFMLNIKTKNCAGTFW